jgi:hypothetical protein
MLMNQAIRTQYFGPSAARGSRIIARCEAGSVTIPYSHEGGEHREAFETLVRKLGWGDSYWVVGGFGQDYYWVMVPAPEEGMPDALMLTGSICYVRQNG